MNKKVLIFGIIAIIGGGVLVWQFWLREEVIDIKERVEKAPIKVEFNIPQSIKTGEIFKGNYSLVGNKKDLEGKMLIICHSKEGAEYVGHPDAEGFPCIFSINPPPGSRPLSAFRITDDTKTSGRTDIFYSPGTYTYSITLHECSKIEEIFPEGDSCGWDIIDKRDIVSKVPHLLKEIKSIVVTGEEIEPECETSADCKEPCEGCDKGPVCLYPHQKCVECTDWTKCKEGYVCIDYKCIKKSN